MHPTTKKPWDAIFADGYPGTSNPTRSYGRNAAPVKIASHEVVCPWDEMRCKSNSGILARQPAEPPLLGILTVIRLTGPAPKITVEMSSPPFHGLGIREVAMSVPRWLERIFSHYKAPYQVHQHLPVHSANQLAHAEHTSGHQVA